MSVPVQRESQNGTAFGRFGQIGTLSSSNRLVIVYRLVPVIVYYTVMYSYTHRRLTVLHTAVYLEY